VTLPGRPLSFWIDTAPGSAYPVLRGAVSADVAVVGAGITGLTVAAFLQEVGASVAVVEAGRVGAGVTGHTTGKLTSLHGLFYDELQRKLGWDTAKAYGEANEAAIARIDELAQEGIECDFERMPAYTYTEREEELSQLEAEVEAATRLGLPASLVTDCDLPFPILGAVRFDRQARFHPRKFCLALADRVAGSSGSYVFEESRVLEIESAPPCHVRSREGVVEAEQVVVATLIPVPDRGFFFARTHPSRSYVLGATADAPTPRGMYITAGSPTRSVRPHPFEAAELLIVSGEGHKVGQASDHAERWQRLANFARERLGASEIRYRWSTQDFFPVDGVPYIGRLRHLSDRMHVATGFKGWGLTHAVVAAMIIADDLAGRKCPWAELYNPERLNLRASATEFVKENTNVGKHFLLDRLTKRARASNELLPGEAKVVSSRGRQVALHKDTDGILHSVSARCTHLGCIVNWNDAERSWDCPCHGSRFSPTGDVLQGPANKPLDKQPL
jgi:glycine/D-amino acid oxidase-like deaminating enzyme/nitrite reductase/ring-hydroxylating ferredoxin subunit